MVFYSYSFDVKDYQINEKVISPFGSHSLYIMSSLTQGILCVFSFLFFFWRGVLFLFSPTQGILNCCLFGRLGNTSPVLTAYILKPGTQVQLSRIITSQLCHFRWSFNAEYWKIAYWTLYCLLWEVKVITKSMSWYFLKLGDTSQQAWHFKVIYCVPHNPAFGSSLGVKSSWDIV